MVRTTRKISSKKKRLKRKKSASQRNPTRASEKEFTNREVGWLNFNQRVLHEAEDSRTPLLERVKFLSISGSNLDEFFMKRVGGLKRQLALGIVSKSADGQTPVQQLKTIRQIAIAMTKRQAEIYEDKIKKDLEKNKVHLLHWKDLKSSEKEYIKKFYMKNVFPVLTPLSVDPGHPFPFISNLSTSLGVTLRHPERDEKLFARIKIPKVLPQWIEIPNTKSSEKAEDKKNSSEYRLISLLEVIQENLADLFPAMEVLKVMPFRLTRNADTDRDEEDAEDLLQMIEEELRQRRFAEVVRLEHGPHPDPWMLEFLASELDLSKDDIYELPSLLDYADLNFISDLPIEELKYSAWSPIVPAVLQEEPSVLNVLSKQDLLVHHPYENFSGTVERFIRQASDDPKVLAIKMTLYRTGDNSPFIKSLIRAAELGKQVVCLIELKARFDEERNIYWAQELENAGVHVVYGVVGLKTHAKVALVVRQESQELKCYAHIGTGNYNVATSRFYTDVGLMTCDERITSELVELFHYLTGRSLKKSYEHLLIAPVNMFTKFKSLIENESENAKKGLPSQIIAKFNNMEENDMALSLYQASQSGTRIDLIVRGFCCLRPQVKGLSENLNVYSVIGRFLEHSRIFYFRNGAENPVDGLFYIGSADWMYRNLHARLEAIVPIYDRQLKEKCYEILQAYLNDHRQTWVMDANGNYVQRHGESAGVQEKLMTLTKQKEKHNLDVLRAGRVEKND